MVHPTKELEGKFLNQYDEAIWDNLYNINGNRIRSFSLILTFGSVVFLIIDYYNRARGMWLNEYGYVLLFYSHIVLIAVSSILLIWYQIKKNKEPLFYKIYSFSFMFFVLNLSAVISGMIDQQIHDQATLYFIILILLAVFINMNPKYTLLLYVESYVVFIYFVTIIQKNSDIRQGLYINASLILIFAYFMSITISRLMQRDTLYKYKLEEMVKERSDSLLQKQREVNRLQQFEVIGTMAGGMAHEIRNPMTSVRGFLQLLGEKDYYSKDKEIFDLMISELDRANEILNHFLSLTRDKKVFLEKKSLNDLITKLLPLINANSKFNQYLNAELGKIPELLLDENEISQVILNLTKNGFEAMPAGGCLTLKTYLNEKNVVLEIQDEGNGIAPEILDKIGTPFFTTKETGTGLGLAVSYSIIKKHNAKIEIQAGPKGTRFCIIF